MTNYTIGNRICKLHDNKLVKGFVGIQYGRGYHNTNNSNFPKAKTRMPGGCVVTPFSPKFALIYHCRKCTKIKNGYFDTSSVSISLTENFIRVIDADTSIYEFVDEFPTFPGGKEKYDSFIVQNITWPNGSCAQGSVITSFVVEPNGTISNIKILRSLGKDFDTETIRIIKLMPNWNPGKTNGLQVRTKITHSIKFMPSY